METLPLDKWHEEMKKKLGEPDPTVNFNIREGPDVRIKGWKKKRKIGNEELIRKWMREVEEEKKEIRRREKEWEEWKGR